MGPSFGTTQTTDASKAPEAGQGTTDASKPSVSPAPVVKATPAPSEAPEKSVFGGAVKPVHVDGALYVAMGTFAALLACLNSDGAAKHIAPDLLWWLQTGTEVINGGVISLKMFRSTGYADSKSTNSGGN